MDESPANSGDSGGESAEETTLQPLSPCSPDHGPPSSAAAAELPKSQSNPSASVESAAPSGGAPAPAPTPAPVPDPTTVVDDWFGGQLRSTVLCMTCAAVSCSHEPFLVSRCHTGTLPTFSLPRLTLAHC